MAVHVASAPLSRLLRKRLGASRNGRVDSGIVAGAVAVLAAVLLELAFRLRGHHRRSARRLCEQRGLVNAERNAAQLTPALTELHLAEKVVGAEPVLELDASLGARARVSYTTTGRCTLTFSVTK